VPIVGQMKLWLLVKPPTHKPGRVQRHLNGDMGKLRPESPFLLEEKIPDAKIFLAFNEIGETIAPTELLNEI